MAKTLYRVTFTTAGGREFYSAFSNADQLNEGIKRRFDGGKYTSAEVTHVEQATTPGGKEKVLNRWTSKPGGK